MTRLDLTLPTPAENLAGDEALLDAAESGKGGEVLRFWESREYFVVVGYANKVTIEVNVAACEARGIPILRRCSGGGAVVQGPGCLNYALVLRIAEEGPTRSISGANQFIMERNRAALESSRHPTNLHASGLPATLSPSDGERDGVRGERARIETCGHTDLAIGGLKFSGNSQRRRKHFLLFHGTFLLNFDLAVVSELLLMPTKQPDYRAGRKHGEFITNLGAPAARVKPALQRAWTANGEYSASLQPEIARLVQQKYSTREWNQKL